MREMVRAAVLVFACLWTFGAGAGERRRVLILYSYGSSMPWQARIHAGLQGRLEEFDPGARPDIYEEQVDAARLGTATTAGAVPPYLEAKYGGVTFDAVIAESPAATQILLAHPELFPGAVRYASDPGSELPATAGGFRVIHPQGEWAVDALTALAGILPALKRVVAITDHSTAGATNKARLLAAAPALPPGVSLEVWDDLTFDEMLDRSAALGPGDAIYYTPMFIDRAGASRVPRDFARALSARSSAPVFAGYEQFLGDSIVGGRLLSPERVGRLLADIASGNDPFDRWPEVEAELNRYAFDGDALRRWGISPGRLPSGSAVVEPEEAAWRRYSWQIAGASAVLILQGCLIVRLITALRQRNAAVGEVVRERDRLENKVAERTEELSVAAARLENSNRHLRELADTDPLTGVANRRSFIAALDDAWSRAGEAGTPVALLMLDIDHFKSVNDRHGHELGDAVIRAVAGVLRAEAGSGRIGRLGGEEFAVLLPGAAAADAQALAERVRAGVGRLSFLGADGDRFAVTVSVGASRRTQPGDAPATALARADAALYRAKRAGRDRVVCDEGLRAEAMPPPRLDVA